MTRVDLLPSEGLKAVLFDFDGTLADTEAYVHRACGDAARTVLGRALTAEELTLCFARPLEFAFERIAPGRGTDLLIAFAREYEGRPRSVRPYPGIPDMLKTLGDRGLSLGVVTSKPRVRAVEEMEGMGLETCFEVVIGFDDVTRPKPHPEPLHRALKVLGLSPRAAVYVGDQPTDVEAASAAGVSAAVALWGAPDPGAWVNSARAYLARTPEDLLSWVGSFGQA